MYLWNWHWTKQCTYEIDTELNNVLMKLTLNKTMYLWNWHWTKQCTYEKDTELNNVLMK